jgi:hypothetical protein
MQFWYGKQFGINASGSPVGQHSLLSAAPGWKTTNAYNGLSTLFVRYEWKKATTQAEADNNPFTGNIPNIKVTMLGRKVLPLDSTAEATDYVSDVNAGRERYSTNPAEIIADYLRNPFYGKGLSNAEIDWASFRIARNKYNQEVTYVSGVKGPILTTNVVLDTNQTIFNNLKSLLQGCRSYLPYVQGAYKLKVEDAGNATDILSGSATIAATFTPDNIVGDISYSGIPRGSKYTQYEVTYVDPNNKWATNTAVYPVLEEDRNAYAAVDGGRENKGSATFPTITNYAMAYDMARLLFEKSRYQESLNLKVTSQAMELEPGDNIQVQGNVLTLTIGEDAIPWRIISIKLNDDWSYDLGCVRNPDSIYPHGRANERDVILPPYIPKYDTILYPRPETDLGLYPPSYAYIGTGSITSPLDPPTPTDPTGTTGGGVGAGDGTQNTNPVTVPPTPTPPPVNTLVDYIDVLKADYTVSGGSVNATIEFLQPPNPNYAGVDFWYKRNIATDTVYKTAQSTTIPGAGQKVSYTFTDLIKGQTPYIVISRVRYTNDYNSTVRGTFTLNVSGAISTEPITDLPPQTQAGWTPPNTTPDPAPVNVGFNSIQAIPTYESAGVPTEDRGLVWTLIQDINQVPYTTEIAGVNIYYKQQDATYWTKHEETFNGSYQPGQAYTFTPTLDLGIRTYPGSDTDPGVPGDPLDDYDFIVRFRYKSGVESTVQLRWMGVNVENTTGAIVLSSFGSGDRLCISEEAGKYQPTLAPAGAVADTRDMHIGIQTVTTLGTGDVINFRITPPDIADRGNWYGVRVRVRTIPLGGGTSAFDTYSYLPVSSSGGIYSITNVPTAYDRKIQYVLTPVVRYGGAKTEGRYSWVGEGTVHKRQTAVDYPSDANWIRALSFKEMSSVNIPELEATPFPTANAVVAVKSWKRVFKNTGYLNSPNYTYFELEYNASHITGLTGVRIYRRAYEPATYTAAKYYGLGRWEYIDVVPGTNATTLDNGNVLVNLRTSTGFTEFNTYYGTTGNTDPLENTTYGWAVKKVLHPLGLRNEFVIVAQTSAGYSVKGIQCAFITGNGVTTTPNPNKEVTLSDYDSCVAGYKRNIEPGGDGSRANTADASLLTANSNTAANYYVAPTPTRGSSVI